MCRCELSTLIAALYFVNTHDQVGVVSWMVHKHKRPRETHHQNKTAQKRNDVKERKKMSAR